MHNLYIGFNGSFFNENFFPEGGLSSSPQVKDKAQRYIAFNYVQGQWRIGSLLGTPNACLTQWLNHQWFSVQAVTTVYAIP